MHTRDISVGGRTLSLETGRLAKQADGSVIVRMGDTMVLVTACADSNPREGVDFLPLTCDYKESAYASGRIPGGFFKREGKPPEKEVLTSRLIDRPIRPLFPDGWRNETQIIALVLSADSENDSDVLAITGASAALALSSIPQTRTLAGVRVGFADGDFIINPPFDQRKRSTLDLVVAGSKDGIVMVEAGAKEVPEAQMVQALERAHGAIKEIVAGIDALAAQAGKTKRPTPARRESSKDLVAEVEGKVLGPLSDAMRIKDKLENYATGDKVLNEFIAQLSDDDLEGKLEKELIAKGLKEKILRDEILESNGSSSTASVCGGSLAMMDAGVPLKAPVAGVAMGLVMNEETGKYAILSDIAGAEDHYGDMDFKVTGTSTGITALQMDIKV